MTRIPENALGLESLEELIEWTTTYFHFKQALEVVPLSPEMAHGFLDSFEEYTSRLAIDFKKQSILEARLPLAMRERIAAEKPNLSMIRELLKQEQNN
jgi:hypothetical protein